MTVRIGEATRHQAAHMWDRFYGDIDEGGKNRDRFLKRLDDLGFFGDTQGLVGPMRQTSTAAIQGLFLFHKDDMEGAIKMIQEVIPKSFEKDQPKEQCKTKAPS